MSIDWPHKTRELHNHHFDSTTWNDFVFRGDDIVIASYAKAGTTWTQQIVAQLLFTADPSVNVSEISPWLDLRVPSKALKLATLEAQTHRRFVKTHLPVDALRFSPRAKYLYVARDGRDVLWSLYHHHRHANASWYEALNDSPGRVGPPIEPARDDIRQYWHGWLERDGHPFWPFWENVRGWWALRTLPNVMLLHFADLKRDLAGEMRRIASFLGIQLEDAHWQDAVAHCGFDWMKQHAAQSAPQGGAFWEGGAGTFINKGTNGRWADTLSAADCADYEARARLELGEACAHWLANGRNQTTCRSNDDF